MTEYSVSTILLYLPLFVVAIFLAFFIPGRLFLRYLKLSHFQSFVLSLVFGMVLWGWQGFIFGFLGIRWATYLYLIIIFLLWFRTDDKNHIINYVRNLKHRPPKLDWILFILIAVGTLFQLSNSFLTGIQQANGILFCFRCSRA